MFTELMIKQGLDTVVVTEEDILDLLREVTQESLSLARTTTMISPHIRYSERFATHERFSFKKPVSSTTPVEWLVNAYHFEDNCPKPARNKSGLFGKLAAAEGIHLRMGQYEVKVRRHDRFAYDYACWVSDETVEDRAPRVPLAEPPAELALQVASLLLQAIVTNVDVPPHIRFVETSYEKMSQYVRECDDKLVTTQIRALLRGERISVRYKMLPQLVTALFFSEVARNPLSYISGLMLLDLIGNKVHDEEGIPYSWYRALWNCELNTSESVLVNGQKHRPKGGKHPMAHQGSFKEFEGDRWQKRFTIAHKKTSTLALRWIYSWLRTHHAGDDFRVSLVRARRPTAYLRGSIAVSNDLSKKRVISLIKDSLMQRIASFSQFSLIPRQDFASTRRPMSSADYYRCTKHSSVADTSSFRKPTELWYSAAEIRRVHQDATAAQVDNAARSRSSLTF